MAAKRLGVGADELETSEGRVYSRISPEKSIAISTLASKGFFEPCGELAGRGFWMETAAPDNPETGQVPLELTEKGIKLAGFYSHEAQGFQVAVNIETGDIRIERCAAVCDAVPINPKMCEQQMEGGLNMGMGTTLCEAIQLHNGRVLNPNFHDYKIPGFSTMPMTRDVYTSMMPTPHKDGPYGAKGIGEVVLTPSAPAIANAIYDAIGIRFRDLPISREKVLEALKGRH
jgi:CO/xanthine dehydrogenase Mo-binding subunit